MRMLKNKKDFKKENQLGWEKNTEYWLNNPLRQVEDTKDFFMPRLKQLVNSGNIIVDMGCGSGWLLVFLQQLGIPFTYIGLDFNKKFIDHLKEKYSSLSNVTFELVDFEDGVPLKYFSVADLVFNCFNFFETADLDAAFGNGVKMLKPNSKLIIFTIEYTYLILALSHDMNEFKSYLKIYEDMKNQGGVPYFFQNIDLGDNESKELKYASVLYSFDDYFKQAKKNNLRLCDYGEVVKTSKYLPKTYQFMVFEN